MKSELKINTSFVSPTTLERFRSNNILPIFIVRNIENSELIGQYSGSPVHLKELSPSNELFRKKRDKALSIDEFKKLYAIEITERVDLKRIIDKLESLVELSGARSVVLLGYGSDYDSCHRSVLAKILNGSGLLEKPVKELVV
jgi:hypothetical protein